MQMADANDWGWLFFAYTQPSQPVSPSARLQFTSHRERVHDSVGPSVCRSVVMWSEFTPKGNLTYITALPSAPDALQGLVFLSGIVIVRKFMFVKTDQL